MATAIIMAVLEWLSSPKLWQYNFFDLATFTLVSLSALWAAFASYRNLRPFKLVISDEAYLNAQSRPQFVSCLQITGTPKITLRVILYTSRTFDEINVRCVTRRWIPWKFRDIEHGEVVIENLHNLAWDRHGHSLHSSDDGCCGQHGVYTPTLHRAKGSSAIIEVTAIVNNSWSGYLSFEQYSGDAHRRKAVCRLVTRKDSQSDFPLSPWEFIKKEANGYKELFRNLLNMKGGKLHGIFTNYSSHPQC